MTSLSPNTPSGRTMLSDKRLRNRFLIGLGLLVGARLLAVFTSPLGLGPDEAQYWRWAQTLDWGYYSKPPLIAWTIAATTAAFGQAEWAVRFAAPFLHGFVAIILFLIGRKLHSVRAGVYAGALYALMPAVSLSSGIISTDALLMPCLSVGLLCLVHLRRADLTGRDQWRWAALVGVALGLGLLAKYAMTYFLMGLALAVIVDAPLRRSLISLKGVLIGAIALAILAPNLIWNAQNDFSTLTHTTENARWGGQSFNLDELGQFAVDQLGMFGPVSFALLLIGLWRLARSATRLRGRDSHRMTTEAAPLPDGVILMACFVLPPLILIAFQAFIARAHGNWAASAYPAASVMVALLAAHAGKAGWLKAGLALNLLVALAMMAFSISPGLAERAGAANSFKRAMGWPETVAAVRQAVAKGCPTGGAYSAIVTDNRLVFHGLDYSGREGMGAPLRMWRRFEAPLNFAETAYTLAPEDDACVLVIVARQDQIGLLARDFERMDPAGPISIPLGGGIHRDLTLFVGSGYRPVPRDAAFEAEAARLKAASVQGATF
jgi:hypothetical protein